MLTSARSSEFLSRVLPRRPDARSAIAVVPPIDWARMGVGGLAICPARAHPPRLARRQKQQTATANTCSNVLKGARNHGSSLQSGMVCCRSGRRDQGAPEGRGPSSTPDSMKPNPANQPMEAGPVGASLTTGQGRRRSVLFLVSLAPIALLLWNIGSKTAGQDFQGQVGEWTRAWDDLAIGAGLAGYNAFPVAPYLVTNRFSRKGQTAFIAFKETLGELERTHGLRASRPWEGFDARALFPRLPRVAQRFDDSGRAYLLGWIFRLLGGVSPGMFFWLAPGLTSLVLLWIAGESLRAGLPVFGMVLAFLVSLSGFCLDLLTLGYSAAGFYLLAVLGSVAYAIGVIGARPTSLGLAGRSLMVGVLLAACIASRSLSAAVLPALFLTALSGAIRLTLPRRLRVAFLVVSLVLILGPTLLLRAHLAASAREAAIQFGGDAAPASHDLWISYWQGLGDFDRTHGHTFLDEAGLAALRANGGEERVSERSEVIMRRLVVADIRANPVWFVELLIKRVFSTVALHKLWPTASSASPGYYPATSPNEGVTDSYWTMTDQADTFRLGPTRMEIPAILLPGALLLFVLARPARNARYVPMTRVVGVVVVAAILGPVAATTAGAFEPQSFVVASFAAMAGLAQMVWDLKPS